MELCNPKILYKIISRYGSEKYKTQNPPVKGQIKLQQRHPRHSKNRQPHMDAAIEIKVQSVSKNLHSTKISNVLISGYYR
jgi:hypothetical protein